MNELFAPPESGLLISYLRVSLEDENTGESESISNQRDLIGCYLKQHPEFTAYKVMEVVDDGHSGTNFDRPGIKRVLELVRQRKVAAILVKDLSRFGRNYKEVGSYLEQVFPFLGVRFISVNDGPIVTCLSYVATGVGKSLADSTWKITIPYAGVHTINIYAREDGAVLHKLYLTQEPLLDHDLPASARVSLLDNDVYSTAGSGALIEGNDAIGTFNVDFDVASNYIVYVDADAKQGAGISLKLGDNSPQTYTFPAGISGWSRAFTLTIDKKGTQSLNLSATGDRKSVV